MEENKVSIRDNGWDRIMREILQGKRMDLWVGVIGEPAAQVHPRTGRQIGEIAAVNEYGEENAPSRSFLRKWVDDNVDRIRREVIRAYVRVVREKITPEAERRELNRLGEKYARQIKSRIERKRIPPTRNAQFTINRKGFDHPLIETEMLLNAIHHEVHK